MEYISERLLLAFGMISTTLLDVATIVSLQVDGDDVTSLYDVFGTDLDFEVNKKNNTYTTFVNTFSKGSIPAGKIKHKAFLLFWIC